MNRERNIRKTFVAILFATIMVFSAVAMMCTTASAATEEEIEASIEMGIVWLLDQQNPDGSWGSDYTVARTGFALVKLEDRSRELGFEPLDPDGPYCDNIIIEQIKILMEKQFTSQMNWDFVIHTALALH